MEPWDTILGNFPYLIVVMCIVRVIVAAVIIEHTATRYLRGFSKRREITP